MKNLTLMPTARPDFGTDMVDAQELHTEILDPTSRNVWQSIEPVTRAEYDAFHGCPRDFS